MNKLRAAVLFVFLSMPAGIYAQDVYFGWSPGNENFFYDALNKEAGADMEILRFNWRFNHFSIGFNLLDIHGSRNFDDNGWEIITSGQYLIFPLEIAYVPLNIGNWLFFSVYGKAGWQLTQQYDGHFNNGFYGSAGVKLFMFPEIDYYYSPYFSLFAEYDTYNRLKLGVSIDVSVYICFLMALAQEYGHEKK